MNCLREYLNYIRNRVLFALDEIEFVEILKLTIFSKDQHLNEKKSNLSVDLYLNLCII